MGIARAGLIFAAAAWSAAATAQPGNKDKLPLGVEHFACGSFALILRLSPILRFSRRLRDNWDKWRAVFFTQIAQGSV